jgi:hypothetical protein
MLETTLRSAFQDLGRDDVDATLVDAQPTDVAFVGALRGRNASVCAPTLNGSPRREKRGTREQARAILASGGQKAIEPEVKGKKGKGGKAKADDGASILELA